MRYAALALDYDGTLATHGKVGPEVLEALDRIRHSGRKVVMVTGREIPDLRRTFDGFDRFDRIVAENGALLYCPATGVERRLAEAPPPSFAEKLRARGVSEISCGQVIVATWEPHQATVLETIHEMGLELQVIFNKGAVMVLPSGVNKSTGLRAALAELCLSPLDVIGMGDAENDHVFLGACGLGVAVENALPALKERADLITRGDHGSGVIEIVEQLLADGMCRVHAARHDVALGAGPDGRLVTLPGKDALIVVTHPHRARRHALAAHLLRGWCAAGYQCCALARDGADTPVLLAEARVLGGEGTAPPVPQVIDVLATPAHHVHVRLDAVPPQDREEVAQEILDALTGLAASYGHPHWITIEAPSPGALATLRAQGLGVLALVDPAHVDAALLATADVVVAAGKVPEAVAAAVGSAGLDPHDLLVVRKDGPVSRLGMPDLLR